MNDTGPYWVCCSLIFSIPPKKCWWKFTKWVLWHTNRLWPQLANLSWGQWSLQGSHGPDHADWGLLLEWPCCQCVRTRVLCLPRSDPRSQASEAARGQPGMRRGPSTGSSPPLASLMADCRSWGPYVVRWPRRASCGAEGRARLWHQAGLWAKLRSPPHGEQPAWLSKCPDPLWLCPALG